MQYARDFRCWVNAGCWKRVSSCKREKSQRATRESCHWKPKRLGAVLRKRSSEHAQRSVPRRHEPRQQGRWANSWRDCTFQTILARVTSSAGLPPNARRRYGEISPPMRRIRSKTHPSIISFLSGAGPRRRVRAIQSGLRWRSCRKSDKSRSRLDPKISVEKGEEVQITRRNKPVAKIVPAEAQGTRIALPAFAARARQIWGETPVGKSLS